MNIKEKLNTGSSDSYSKKYALGGLLNLDESQDDDATNTHGKTRKDII